MPKVKKLTVKVFDDPECPVDATCAAVDASGEAHWFIEEPDGVVTTQSGIWDTAEDWTPISGKFDNSDWENSKIINPHWKGKKLTAEVFDDFNLSFDPVCAIVQPDGSAHFCATADLEPVDDLEIRGWSLTKAASLKFKGKKRDEIWGDIEGDFDPTDWQHSLVLRPCFVQNGAHIVEIDNSWKPALRDKKEEPPITEEEPSKDVVNHPEHYCVNGLECFEVMRQIFGDDDVRTFCRLNAFKYLWRSKRKNGNQDIAKAAWYTKKYTELSGDKNGQA